MKTSTSNEFIEPGEQKSAHHHSHQHQQNQKLTSSDIDTLKMREIEELKFERIKKKSEKQLPSNAGRNQHGRGNNAADPSHAHSDSDDYINLTECSSKKG